MTSDFEQLAKVLGTRFSADLAALAQGFQDKPVSAIEVSAPAPSVGAKTSVTESPRLSVNDAQILATIRSSSKTRQRYEMCRTLVERYAPHLQATLKAHFGALAIDRPALKQNHVWHSSTKMSIPNGIEHNLTKSGLPPERKISSCRAMLREVTNEADRQILEAQIKEYELSVLPLAPALEAPTVLRPSLAHCKLDPAISRAACLVGDGAAIRAYWIIQELITSSFKGSGHAPFEAIKTRLQSLGMHKVYDVLLQGEKAGYWAVSRGYRSIKEVYLTGIKKMASIVLDKLSDKQLLDFTGNQAPGSGRMVWVDCSGSTQTFYGNLIGAWLEQRHEEGVKISNARLAQLWGVTPRTIQNRRARVGITGTPNFADGDSSIAPAHAVGGMAGSMRWQMVNTYFPPGGTRRHSHRGQQAKVRRIALISLKNRGFSPADGCAGGEAEQRYFDGETARDAEKNALKAMRKQRAADRIYIYQETRRWRSHTQYNRYLGQEVGLS